MTASVRTGPDRLPPLQFWGLTFALFMALQIPLIRIPVLYLSTWAHEFGHGLGALVTGGEFVQLTIFPNFSGIALTATEGGFARAIVVMFGLLGPSVLGVLMILLTRGAGLYRLTLLLMAGLLALTLVWAADPFTVFVLLISAGLFGLIGWKAPNKVVFYLAQIVAIALCLTALTGFGYFFMGNANVSGQLYRTDTGILADIFGGPHWLWGGVMVALSIIILVLGVIAADGWARSSRPGDA